MIDPDDQTTRTRLILVAIIVASLICYCLGWVVLQGAERARGGLTGTETPTASLSPIMLDELSPTPPILVRTATMSPTPTPSWTASLTFTQFVPPTATPTETPEPPTATATETETFVPSETPQPPSVTPSPIDITVVSPPTATETQGS